jgi:hypothetical protein
VERQKRVDLTRSPHRLAMTVICAKLPYEVAPPKDSSRRKADLVCCRATGAALPDVKLSRETEVLSGPRSQPSGDQNRLPEKHAKKYNNKDAKDKAPPIGIEGVIVLGGSAVRNRSRRNQLDACQQAQSHARLLKIS